MAHMAPVGVHMSLRAKSILYVYIHLLEKFLRDFMGDFTGQMQFQNEVFRSTKLLFFIRFQNKINFVQPYLGSDTSYQAEIFRI